MSSPSMFRARIMVYLSILIREEGFGIYRTAVVRFGDIGVRKILDLSDEPHGRKINVKLRYIIRLQDFSFGTFENVPD